MAPQPKLSRRDRLIAEIQEQVAQNSQAAVEFDRNGIVPGPEVLFSAQIRAIITTMFPEGSTDRLILDLNFHKAMWEMFFSQHEQIVSSVNKRKLVDGVNLDSQQPGQGNGLITPPGFMKP